MTQPSFDRFGPAIPVSPVVLSVPHAGRDYPDALRSALLVPLATARLLEDRHVDAVAIAARGEETMFVQRRARAWIDLNRGEDERDPAVDAGAVIAAPGVPDSARVRGGLGLVPRRAGPRGELWRRRWTDAEVMARIVADHRPYHAALGAALRAAHATFGVAVLIDVHSMPPLAGAAPARIVVGDRHAMSADSLIAARVMTEAARLGLRTARNLPYAGGHIVERHGNPAMGIHAVQIEIDRTLYLDRSLDMPSDQGVIRSGALLRCVIDALALACASDTLSSNATHSAAFAAE